MRKMNNKTAIEITEEMMPGWNMGNSLDAHGDNSGETQWGNPVITQEMVQEVQDMGFNTLRVPVTWYEHLDDEYNIEPSWLNRVYDVVNYGLDLGMYVIVNIHHDESWIPLMVNASECDNVKHNLQIVWAQIATKFMDCDDHLVFETLNEPRTIDSEYEWSGGTPEERDCLNQYHTACVDAIRETGGKNTDRFIMVSTYAASTVTIAMEELEIPNNDENIIVSLHSYFPYEFCLDESGTTEWGTDEDIEDLADELDRIQYIFTSDNRAVVMGEWGSLHKDNIAERTEHAESFANSCVDRDICPIVWDNGNENELGLLNRQNFTDNNDDDDDWYYPDIAEAIVNSVGKEHIV